MTPSDSSSVPRSAIPALVAVVVLLGAGCRGSGSHDDADAVTKTGRRDSAGVTIVSNPANAPKLLRADTIPRLELGTSGQPYFYQVRGAFRLSTGTIVVANAGSNQFFYFGDDGRFVRAAGRAGEGPGEFSSMYWIGRIGDTVAAWDVREQRVSYFGPNGEFLRLSPLRPTRQVRVPRPVGLLDDSTLAVIENLGAELDQAPARIARDTATIYRADSAGALQAVIGTFSGDEFVVFRSTYGNPNQSAQWQRWPREFGHKTLFGASAGRLVVADDADFAIDLYARDGALVERIRKAWRPPAVTQNDIDAELGLMTRSGSPGMTKYAEQVREHGSPPDSFPAYDTMVIGRDGSIWVRSYVRYAEPLARWWEFSKDGTLEASVELPWHLLVSDLGEDFALGVWFDSNEVQTVREYALSNR